MIFIGRLVSILGAVSLADMTSTLFFIRIGAEAHIQVGIRDHHTGSTHYSHQNRKIERARLNGTLFQPKNKSKALHKRSVVCKATKK